jgi:hypothetical protein
MQGLLNIFHRDETVGIRVSGVTLVCPLTKMPESPKMGSMRLFLGLLGLASLGLLGCGGTPPDTPTPDTFEANQTMLLAGPVTRADGVTSVSIDAYACSDLYTPISSIVFSTPEVPSEAFEAQEATVYGMGDVTVRRWELTAIDAAQRAWRGWVDTDRGKISFETPKLCD